MRRNDTPDFGADAYVHDDGCVYSADRTVLLACTSELESCKVLDTCTSIAAKAFKSCKRLKRVTVPDGLVELGDFAFAFSGLEEFDCPPTLRCVGKKAFYSCASFRACHPSRARQARRAQLPAITGVRAGCTGHGAG